MKRIFLLFLTFFICSFAYADTLKQFIVLGDSLSDNGNLYRAIKILPKSPPYFQGRFSNGPTWAENVGNYLYSKYYMDYQIYAYGGATAILHNPETDNFVAPVTLDEELYSYLMHSLLIDKSKVLYAIWIGANDYLYEHTMDLNGITDAVVNKIIETTNALIKQGGKNFLILNLPDLSKTPYARSNGITDRLATITVMHNQKLFAAVEKLKANNPNVKIIFFDVDTAFNDLLVNPAKYNALYNQNITNTTEACWVGGFFAKQNQHFSSAINADLKQSLHASAKNINTQPFANFILNSPGLMTAYKIGKTAPVIQPCAEPAKYVFWDELHPTSASHQILADMVIGALNL